MFFFEDFLSVLEIEDFLGVYFVRDFGEFFEVGFNDAGLHGVFFHVLVLFFFSFEDLLDVIRGVFFVEIFGDFFEEN